MPDEDEGDFGYWWEYDEENAPPSHFVDEEGNCWVEVTMTEEETIEFLSHLIEQEEKG